MNKQSSKPLISIFLEYGIITEELLRDKLAANYSLDIVDLERASKTAGARFYYLKGGLVKLAQALTAFALDFVTEKKENQRFLKFCKQLFLLR